MLGGSLEENVICAIAWSDTLAPQVALKVKPNDFSIAVYRRIVTKALDYLTQYHRPARAHLADLLEQDLHRGADGRFMREVLIQMERLAPNIDDEYVLAELDRFLDKQRLINAVNAASDLLHNDELEAAREVLRAPDLLPKDNPGVWLRDSENWLQFLRDDEDVERFSSGIEVLDEHNVRPARGELFIFLAATGKGKSWFLINVGRHNLLQRNRKVLHLTLENSLDTTLQRYTQCFLSLTRDQAKTIDLPIFRDSKPESFTGERRNGRGREHTEYAHDSGRHFESLRSLGKGELLDRLRPFQSRGQLLVKHFPTGTLTMGTLDAFLQALETNEGFKPDIVLLDYLTLMQLGDPQHIRMKIGQLARDLRGLAEIRNFALVTVAQAGRVAYNRQWTRGHHVAEDWSLMGTSDTFLTYSQTMHEHSLKIARVLVEKSRNSSDKWSAYITQEYEIGQFCLDSDLGSQDLREQLAEKTGEDEE
jgi:replicative DNA helicase